MIRLLHHPSHKIPGCSPFLWLEFFISFMLCHSMEATEFVGQPVLHFHAPSPGGTINDRDVKLDMELIVQKDDLEAMESIQDRLELCLQLDNSSAIDCGSLHDFQHIRMMNLSAGYHQLSGWLSLPDGSIGAPALTDFYVNAHTLRDIYEGLTYEEFRQPATDVDLSTSASPIIGCIFGGRWGNHLFQAAHALAQGWAHQRDVVFFPIADNQRRDFYTAAIFRNLRFGRPDIGHDAFSIVKEEGRGFYPVFPVEDRHTIFEGYFQSSKYWSGYEERIRSLFSPPLAFRQAMEAKYPALGQSRCISLHVRRGDYVTFQGLYPVITIDYIYEALKVLVEPGLEVVLFVFSDDLDWARENLSDLSQISMIHFVREEEDYMELWLMSLCHDHIIANSSFSWWGAYLNARSDKRVVAPAKWFGEDAVISDRWEDIYEPDMIIVRSDKEEEEEEEEEEEGGITGTSDVNALRQAIFDECARDMRVAFHWKTPRPGGFHPPSFPINFELEFQEEDAYCLSHVQHYLELCVQLDDDSVVTRYCLGEDWSLQDLSPGRHRFLAWVSLRETRIGLQNEQTIFFNVIRSANDTGNDSEDDTQMEVLKANTEVTGLSQARASDSSCTGPYLVSCIFEGGLGNHLFRAA